jgi:hypothetical protein
MSKTEQIAVVNDEIMNKSIAAMEVADDGFLDYTGPIDESRLVDTRYDGMTWVPHLDKSVTQYSERINAEKLAEISKPVTRQQVTGKLVKIDAFGGVKYALGVNVRGETAQLLLPEHAALYARLDRVPDDCLIRVDCVGFYDEANQHGTRTTKYDVLPLQDISKAEKKAPLWPEIAAANEKRKAAKNQSKS